MIPIPQPRSSNSWLTSVLVQYLPLSKILKISLTSPEISMGINLFVYNFRDKSFNLFSIFLSPQQTLLLSHHSYQGQHLIRLPECCVLAQYLCSVIVSFCSYDVLTTPQRFSLSTSLQSNSSIPFLSRSRDGRSMVLGFPCRNQNKQL